jgi:hypothetical protein
MPYDKDEEAAELMIAYRTPIQNSGYTLYPTLKNGKTYTWLRTNLNASIDAGTWGNHKQEVLECVTTAADVTLAIMPVLRPAGTEVDEEVFEVAVKATKACVGGHGIGVLCV